jgi:hypothetical protein
LGEALLPPRVLSFAVPLEFLLVIVLAIPLPDLLLLLMVTLLDALIFTFGCLFWIRDPDPTLLVFSPPLWGGHLAQTRQLFC